MLHPKSYLNTTICTPIGEQVVREPRRSSSYGRGTYPFDLRTNIYSYSTLYGIRVCFRIKPLAFDVHANSDAGT